MAESRRAVADALARHREQDKLPDGGLFLVAVSGGADSLALAWAAQFVLPREGFELEAVIVDHGLQGDSAQVAGTAGQTLEQLGLTATIVQVQVDGDANVEQRARDARYQALSEVAAQRGAIGVLLGHTLNDQAETVLMGLTRGSGPASIQGMEPVSGLWWRPFLGVDRATTQQVCRDVGITWWDDPHNVDKRFLRPRLRHEVMPLLEDTMGPGVAEALGRTAALIRQDNEALEQRASVVLAELGDQAGQGALPVEALAGWPSAIGTRVIRQVASRVLGSSLSATHTQEVWRLVVEWRGQGPIDIPGGRVERQEGILRFISDSDHTRSKEHN